MTNLGLAGSRGPVSQVIAAWAARLSDLLYRQTGAKPTVRHMGASRQEPDSAALWWQCDVAGTPTTVFIGADDSSWRTLAGMLRNSDVTAEDRDAKQAYLRLLRESFDPRGTAIDREPQSNRREIVEICFPDTAPIRLNFIAEPKPGPRSGFGVLLNVEMPITIRFGAAKILLQDLLGVNAGSTIEFDRRLNDPVEILVNGRTVARGEAVVVRGSYGVRITEIADQQDRLETSAAVTQSSYNRSARIEEIE